MQLEPFLPRKKRKGKVRLACRKKKKQSGVYRTKEPIELVIDLWRSRRLEQERRETHSKNEV